MKATQNRLARCARALQVCAALALAGVATAQNAAPPPPAAAPAPPVAASPSPATRAEEVERQAEDLHRRAEDLHRLEDARQRLAEAAREVAELTARTTGGLDPGARQSLGIQSRRAVIGVQLDPSSGRDGVRVQQVSPGGPAAEAGVKPGDLIVAIDSVRLAGADDSARRMLERMQRVEPEQKLRLKIRRGERTLDVDVVARAAPALLGRRFAGPGSPTIVGVPASPGVPAVPGAPGTPPAPFVLRFPEGLERLGDLERLDGLFGGIPGLELATLTPKLGEYFGTPRGVLVLRAPRDAASWKLEEGDVILAIDGREPSSSAHATRILRSYQPGEKLSLAVMRQRKRVTLAVTLPAEGSASRAAAEAATDKIGRCNDPTSPSSCPRS